MSSSFKIEGIDEMLDGLKTARSKLEDAHLRLQERYKDLFQNCVSAQAAKNRPKATIFANECAEVKRLSRVTGKTLSALNEAISSLEKIPSNPKRPC